MENEQQVCPTGSQNQNICRGLRAILIMSEMVINPAEAMRLSMAQTVHHRRPAHLCVAACSHHRRLWSATVLE